MAEARRKRSDPVGQRLGSSVSASFFRFGVPDLQITGRDERDFARLCTSAAMSFKSVRAEVFLPNRRCWLYNACEYRQDYDEWSENEEEGWSYPQEARDRLPDSRQQLQKHTPARNC